MSVQQSDLNDPALLAEVDLARAAAQVEAGEEQVGDHVDVHIEDEAAVTHLFEADKAGYRGWRWAVTVTSAGPDTDVTISEVVLLPGPDALVAPEWVPWEDRVRAGDLGVGDLMPTAPDDSRLVPAYLESDDPAVEEIAREAGLGRSRVLSRPGRLEAATRWQHGEFGPRSDMARSAPGRCGTCGFYLSLAGALRAAFGTCGNEISPADGHVVHVEYGCGAHSEAEVEQVSPVLVADLIYDDAQLDVEPLDTPAPPTAAESTAPTAAPTRDQAATPEDSAEPQPAAEVVEPVAVAVAAPEAAVDAEQPAEPIAGAEPEPATEADAEPPAESAEPVAEPTPDRGESPAEPVAEPEDSVEPKLFAEPAEEPVEPAAPATDAAGPVAALELAADAYSPTEPVVESVEPIGSGQIAEPAPATKPESAAESGLATEPESAAEAEPTAEPEPAAEAEPATAPEPTAQAGPATESAGEPEPVAEAEPTAEAELAAEPEPFAEAESTAKAEPAEPTVEPAAPAAGPAVETAEPVAASTPDQGESAVESAAPAITPVESGIVESVAGPRGFVEPEVIAGPATKPPAPAAASAETAAPQPKPKAEAERPAGPESAPRPDAPGAIVVRPAPEPTDPAAEPAAEIEPVVTSETDPPPAG